jgi:hypothetical protein
MLGTPNQYTSHNGVLKVPVADQLKFYDAWGSQLTYPHMARWRGPGHSTRRSNGPSTAVSTRSPAANRLSSFRRAA